jgi:hypothetical protein
MPRDATPTHEANNREQDDADAQAQTVADEALSLTSADPSEDSERGGSGDRTALTPDDAPDLIDRMEQMVSSGHIDMDAYRGEPAHDDEADSYGADPNEIDEADGVPYER